MILLQALIFAVLFAAGSYLMLKRDLIRLIAGMILIGNAANLFIMSAALRKGKAAIYPLSLDTADPLVQAMVLTAIVISFATVALAMSLVYRVYMSHDSVDLGRLSRAEEQESEAEEPIAEDFDYEEDMEDDEEDAG